MVLCVYQILHLKDTSAASNDESTTMLELSDGWYRIRAELDLPLRRAVEQRRIRVGHKLGIAASMLNSLDDGSPVLDALGTSDIRLCANSTAFVHWATRLGFQRNPFVSSLGRLMAEGGTVAAMEIVLSRVYPLGFVETRADARNTSVTGTEHGEADEEEQKALWNAQRMAAREHLSRSVGRLQRIAAFLEKHVMPCEPLDGALLKGAWHAEACMSSPQMCQTCSSHSSAWETPPPPSHTTSSSPGCRCA